MGMSIGAAIRDAIIRHILQAIGSSLVTAGAISAAQEAALLPLLMTIIGSAISIFSVVWGARGGTDRSLITATVNLPVVDKGQTRVVVTDPSLAAGTPASVVYGRDVSIQ
jgi:mannose/fructose/N-acetylgalactosamine-specific phosphotransferase system component IID